MVNVFIVWDDFLLFFEGPFQWIGSINSFKTRNLKAVLVSCKIGECIRKKNHCLQFDRYAAIFICDSD